MLPRIRRPIYSIKLPLVVHSHKSYRRLRTLGIVVAVAPVGLVMTAIGIGFLNPYMATLVLFAGFAGMLPAGLLYILLRYRPQGELRLSELSIAIDEDGKDKKVYFIPYINNIVLQAEGPTEDPYSRFHRWASLTYHKRAAGQCRLMFDYYDTDTGKTTHHSCFFRVETKSEYDDLVFLSRKWDHLIVNCEFALLSDTPQLPESVTA